MKKGKWGAAQTQIYRSIEDGAKRMSAPRIDVYLQHQGLFSQSLTT